MPLTNPELPLFFASIELTDVQIKTLPTTPVVIVPATETLNYSGFPSAIPIAISATVVVDNSAGAYTTDSDAFLTIGMGSDWSTTLTQKAPPNSLTNAGVNQVTLASLMVVPAGIAPPTSYTPTSAHVNLNDSVLDNAIVLAASNAGDFGGGNAANKVWVVLTYRLLSMS